MRAAPAPARGFFFGFVFIYLHQKVTHPPFGADLRAGAALPNLRVTRPRIITESAHETADPRSSRSPRPRPRRSPRTPADVPYPANYRDWTHVKSMVIEPGHALHASFGGIHHLYANAEAMAAIARANSPMARSSCSTCSTPVAKDHAVTEGARKVVGVMHRDARKYAATGGWGFEGFAGDSHTAARRGRERRHRVLRLPPGETRAGLRVQQLPALSHARSPRSFSSINGPKYPCGCEALTPSSFSRRRISCFAASKAARSCVERGSASR